MPLGNVVINLLFFCEHKHRCRECFSGATHTPNAIRNYETLILIFMTKTNRKEKYNGMKYEKYRRATTRMLCGLVQSDGQSVTMSGKEGVLQVT